jgi:4-diphosphocytidyl-2-C-methyl-D-erythritol kinase
MKEMHIKARGKINLGLDVVRRREDGYHEVRMIMQTVSLFDHIVLRRGEGDGIRILSRRKTYLPLNENNLAYKAADLLRQEFGLNDSLDITLDKRIPVAAGMAGGSADAAAVLYGVNRMYRLGLSMEELQKRGVKIGADVPYCLLRGTALAEGIGEILTPLPPAPACHLVIAKPPIGVSTKWVYGHLKANEITDHPDIDGLIRCLENQDLKGLCEKMGNVLEDVTIPAHPVIGEIRQIMLAQGALGARMSGSGPTVFGIFDSPTAAARCADLLKKKRCARDVFQTGFYSAGHAPEHAEK